MRIHFSKIHLALVESYCKMFNFQMEKSPFVKDSWFFYSTKGRERSIHIFTGKNKKLVFVLNGKKVVRKNQLLGFYDTVFEFCGGIID